jgi:hypothetical protein
MWLSSTTTLAVGRYYEAYLVFIMIGYLQDNSRYSDSEFLTEVL